MPGKPHRGWVAAMIVTKIRGGLGNQLFTYSAGRYLSVLHDTPLLLDASWYETGRRPFWLDQFQIEADVSRKDHSNADDGVGYNQQRWCFYTGFLNFSGYKFLSGWWQSERFFVPIAETIRDDLAFSNTGIVSEARERFRQIRGGRDGPFVAMHVRRQDYVKLAPSGNFALLNEPYYRAAMAKFPRHSIFLLFSDDLPWCRAHMNHPGIEFCEIEDTLISFAMMQLCDHYIIANSTFSWWAAWLGETPGKKVVTPLTTDWFGPNLTKAYETGHIIPSRWHQLPSDSRKYSLNSL